MAALECPKCGTRFSTGMGWAKAAISTLIPAPAVPDMATQVRCPKCQYLFADGEVRHRRAGTARTGRIVARLAALAIFAWAVWQLVQM